MEDENSFYHHNFEPVPKTFWSDLSGKPFDSCMLCEKYLLDDGTQYLVEKAIKTYKGREISDTIFEYAICMPCRDKMHKQISTDSKRKLNAYFEEKFDMQERVKRFENGSTLEDRLQYCLVREEEKTDGGEYQIFAFCDGKDIMLDVMPYMITGEAMDEIVGLLSAETIDEINGFMNEHFNGPPEFKEILTGPRVFI